VDSKKGGGSSFIYLAGQRIAEDHWNCGTNTHVATYFHSDALGSPVATTDANRTVLERTYYAPYGEALNRTVDGPGYTGHVMDAATGLVYAQQRYYDPLVGTFLSIDPVAADPGTGGNFNRYWYANDNPYTFVDPDGEFANFVVKAVVDFGLEVAIQVATTGEVDLGAAAVETAKGLVNPLKTLQKVQTIAKIAKGGNKAAKAATLAANKAKGAKAEDTVAAAMGDAVAGRRVTLEASTGQRSVADIVTKDGGVVEVKSGGARLSPGQKAVQADIDAGRSVTPRGQNAANAGLEPGKAVPMKCFDETRC